MPAAKPATSGASGEESEPGKSGCLLQRLGLFLLRSSALLQTWTSKAGTATVTKVGPRSIVGQGPQQLAGLGGQARGKPNLVESGPIVAPAESNRNSHPSQPAIGRCRLCGVGGSTMADAPALSVGWPAEEAAAAADGMAAAEAATADGVGGSARDAPEPARAGEVHWSLRLRGRESCWPAVCGLCVFAFGRHPCATCLRQHAQTYGQQCRCARFVGVII